MGAQEVRDGGKELLDMLEPWTLQVPQVQVVPAARWLRPEVQVPLAKEALALALDPDASTSEAKAFLQLHLALHASSQLADPESNSPSASVAVAPGVAPAGKPKK